MSEQKIQWYDEYCHICGNKINSWDKRCNKTLAYKKVTCEKCMAKEYDLEVDAFRSRLERFFGMRPCIGI